MDTVILNLKTEMEDDVKNLVFYDEHGEASSSTSSNKKYDHIAKLNFNYNIKKIVKEQYNFSDCIIDMGGLAAIFGIIIYFLAFLLGLYIMSDFIRTLCELIVIKYKEARYWKQIHKYLDKFRKIHSALLTIKSSFDDIT